VAAGVTANLGAPLDEVYAEALAALKQKENALGVNHPAPVQPAAAKEKKKSHSGKAAETIRLTLRNEHGLHARPAAQLIRETRPFRAEITVRNLSNRRGPVSVQSLSGLASLEILQGNEIEFAASGDDAHDALEKIVSLIEAGLGDDLPARTNGKSGKRDPAPQNKIRKTTSAPIPIFDGIAIGLGTYLRTGKLEIPQDQAGDVAIEVDRLRTAVAATQKAIETRREGMKATIGEKDAGIYDAQVLALQDPELIESAIGFIRGERANAALAWDRANRQVVAGYEALSNPYLRERAADLEDVGRQVLESLLGAETAPAFPTEPGILIADNLTPCQVSMLNPRLVRGVILLDGGPTAHSSILLRALGLPAIAQARSALANVDLDRPSPLAFDGSTGEIWLDPTADFTAGLESRQFEHRQRADEEGRTSHLPAKTSDGHPIEIFANIGDVSEVELALDSGAEGVGLLRTEFLFLDRATAPGEDEQYQALLAIAEKMNGQAAGRAHARRWRGQAASLSPATGRGKSVSRRARDPSLLLARGTFRDAIARDSPRGARPRHAHHVPDDRRRRRSRLRDRVSRESSSHS
jgi:phosphotransferase system HPr (HPr) family protein